MKTSAVSHRSRSCRGYPSRHSPAIDGPPHGEEDTPFTRFLTMAPTDQTDSGIGRAEVARRHRASLDRLFVSMQNNARADPSRPG